MCLESIIKLYSIHNKTPSTTHKPTESDRICFYYSFYIDCFEEDKYRYKHKDTKKSSWENTISGFCWFDSTESQIKYRIKSFISQKVSIEITKFEAWLSSLFQNFKYSFNAYHRAPHLTRPNSPVCRHTPATKPHSQMTCTQTGPPHRAVWVAQHRREL